MASLVLNCKVRRLSFVYLDLPIDGDARCLAFLDSLISRIKARLSG